MGNFEKQLLEKLPKYYEDGLIDAFSEQRLRAHLNSKISAGAKFTMLPLYFLGGFIALLGVILCVYNFWDTYSDAAKLLLGFVPLAASAVFGAAFLLRNPQKRKPYWGDRWAIANIAGVMTATLVANNVLNTSANGDIQTWLAIFITLLPIPFIFGSQLAALAEVFMFVCLQMAFDYKEATHSALNLLYFLNFGLVFFIIRSFEKEAGIRAFNIFAYTALFAIAPFALVRFSDGAFLGLALAATIPFLTCAKEKGNIIPTIFPWIFAISLIFGVPEFSKHETERFAGFAFSNFSGAEVCGKLALVGLYGFVLYAALKFAKTFFLEKSNKAFCLMPTFAFAFIAIINLCPAEKMPAALAAAMAVFVFVASFAFFVSGFLRRKFTLLNCGSMLLAAWALQKFFNSQENMLSASKTLVAAGAVILIVNVIFGRILKNQEEIQ